MATKKKAKHYENRKPGTFIRFDEATRVWLSQKARDDGRSIPGYLRRMVEQQMKSEPAVATEPVEVAAP